MMMPGRKYSADGSYRYGFNGKENDNEVKGEGNQQDYGMRIYDPRLGKFLSVDPLMKNYPSWSPYPFAMNRPIDGIDLDGLEWWRVIVPGAGVSEVILKYQYTRDVADGFYERAKATVMGVWNIITGKGNGGGVDYERVFGSSHTGIANDWENWGDPQYAAELFTSFFDGVITDYANLIQATFEGDGKAAGALLFEAFLFFLPEAKGASTAKVLSKPELLLTAEKTLGNASDAIIKGGREFGKAPLEEVIINPNRGLTIDFESGVGRSSTAQIYEDGVIGAATDIASKKRIVPALRYNNTNPRGRNIVKFDGFEELTNTLIDRKWNVTTFRKSINQVQRMSEAIRQNTGFNAVIEVPNARVYRRALKLLEKARVDNISVRIAK